MCYIYRVVTASERRQSAMVAIQAVISGVVARDAETEIVDFKEERDTRDQRGQRKTIPPNWEPAAAALASEVSCFANSEAGGVLVIGVDDSKAGLAALAGSYLDAEWLRRRIHALTQPSYTVSIEELIEAGVRLLLIDVPPALEEIRCGGRLRARFGTSCEELTGDRARQFLERRRGYDWSAEPSGLHFADADPGALQSAREKYQSARGQAPLSDLELCRRLGLTRLGEDDENPELNRAGALLLTTIDPDVEQLTVLLTDAEGLPSNDDLRGFAPLLNAFDAAWQLLVKQAFPARTTVIGVNRRLLRSVPDVALRESIVNAIMHRDYRYPRKPVVVQAIGGRTLKVRSPGGFVSGVRADRLISVPSTPRNPVLARALRGLGLAEGEGVGVDTMYSLMLRDGHPSPVILEESGDIVVTLHGGNPDARIAAFFESVASIDRSLTDVRTAIAVTALMHARILRSEELARQAQCSTPEADGTLHRLQEGGVVERLVNRSMAYRFTKSSLDSIGDLVRYPMYRALDQHLDLVMAYLDANPEIGRDDAASLLGVATNYASRILRQLSDKGEIEPVANARGAGVRYKRRPVDQ